MGAFSIAFDILVVGALAIPWALLVVHLFFSGNENTLETLLPKLRDQLTPALGGILLFAIAFPLGSVVSRIAQDFFDDDDLHIHAFHYLFRVGVTESSIRTDVFCKTFKPEAGTEQGDSNLTNSNLPKAAGTATKDAVVKKVEDFRSNDPNCIYTGRWVIRTVDPETRREITAVEIGQQQDRALDVFKIHEAAVLLKGTDATERLRQFHDQIMVLRGASFSGIITFSLCLFWWASRFQSVLRWSVLLLYLFPGTVATVNHVNDHIHDPPYMEFTFFVLAATGARLLWRRRNQSVPEGQSVQKDQEQSANPVAEIRIGYLVLAFFLTASSFLGWWATQVLYDQQVIYSYKALTASASKPPDAGTN